MSLESVRAFLQANAPDIKLIETDDSSSTVELAANVHGVEPAQIAKTICLRVGDKTLLVVASGIARLDNRKVKDVLGGKGRTLDPEQVLTVTGHSVSGVCPFGLLSPLPVFCDISLRRFKEVVPAAGSGNAALKIATERARRADERNLGRCLPLIGDWTMSLDLHLEITRSLGIKEPDPPSGLGRVVEGLSSWFEVSGLAEASIAAAAAQVALRRPLARQMTLTHFRTFGFVGWGKRQRTHHLVQDDGFGAAQAIQRRLPKMGPQ